MSDPYYRAMSVRDLAMVISEDWSSKGKGVNFAAKPYLDAMYALDTVQDAYGLDDGKSIVRYFLSNATSWRGEVAKAVKAELKSRL